MNEKYISGLGAGLILISFGVIVSFFIGDTVEDLKNKVIVENSTLHSELKNTTSVNGTS